VRLPRPTPMQAALVLAGVGAFLVGVLVALLS
jgi:hypothetical protein